MLLYVQPVHPYCEDLAMSLTDAITALENKLSLAKSGQLELRDVVNYFLDNFTAAATSGLPAKSADAEYSDIQDAVNYFAQQINDDSRADDLILQVANNELVFGTFGLEGDDGCVFYSESLQVGATAVIQKPDTMKCQLFTLPGIHAFGARMGRVLAMTALRAKKPDAKAAKGTK
jgi:hypothetical protein